MSEVFLTKTERKTIIIQSFVFVIIMFIVSDAMVVGPFWFKMFPWLYILGIISKSKLSKSITTLLIVCFTTFISSILKTGGLNIEVLIITLNSIFMVMIGIITGTFLKELKLGHNLVKFIPKRKKIYMTISTFFVTLIALLINFAINGNLFIYVKSRLAIESFLIDTYNINKYEIIESKYKIINFEPEYNYIIKCDDVELRVKYKNDCFEDVNYNERKQHELEYFQPLITKYLKDKLVSNKYIFVNNIEYKFDFRLKNIKPNKLNVYIYCNINKKDERYKELIKTINIINDFKEIEKYITEYVIVDDKYITSIRDNKLNNLSIQYLKDSFNINEIN